MSDFWQGFVIWLCVIASMVLLFMYLGRSWVYNDQHKDQLMVACQSNGYTWGECFNVIHGSKDGFEK